MKAQTNPGMVDCLVIADGGLAKVVSVQPKLHKFVQEVSGAKRDVFAQDFVARGAVYRVAFDGRPDASRVHAEIDRLKPAPYRSAASEAAR